MSRDQAAFEEIVRLGAELPGRFETELAAGRRALVAQCREPGMAAAVRLASRPLWATLDRLATLGPEEWRHDERLAAALRSRRLDARSDRGRFVTAQLAAGCVAAALFAVFTFVLGRALDHVPVDLRHFTLHPWSVVRLTLLAAMAGLLPARAGTLSVRLSDAELAEVITAEGVDYMESNFRDSMQRRRLPEASVVSA